MQQGAPTPLRTGPPQFGAAERPTFCRVVEICGAERGWTIVVLRIERRTRSKHADVAQLVAHNLAKVGVAGSNPVIRSMVQTHQPSGGVAEW